MKRSFRVVFNFVFLTTIVITLFVYAMFQGGFVSWFLFYSFLPIYLYYICLLVYPIHQWKVDGKLSHAIVHAGDQVTLTITMKRTIPFPINYCICEQVIPETLHKRDTRHGKFDAFHDPSLIRYHRQAKRMIFPWFRRTIRLSFDFPHVPRGEHHFKQLKVRTGDLFGLINKQHTFQFDHQFIAYPMERATHITQQLSSFDGGSVSAYMLQLKNTNIASGVREYVAGDRFSWIDWKQTARQQQFMTKEFEQEKNAEMMLIFDGTYHSHMNPIAFEGAIELTLSLVKEITKENGQVGMLSLGQEIVQFPAHDSLFLREHVRQHLARINPAGETPLSMLVQNELMKIDRHYFYVLVTTVFNDQIKRTVDQLKFRSAKLVVLFIQAKQLITQKERENMQHVRSQGISVHLVTEQQLKNDPIEVKF